MYHHLPFFLDSSFLLSIVAFFTFSKGTDNLNAAVICSLNKRLFMNREFPLTAVRILAGKNFSFESKR